MFSLVPKYIGGKKLDSVTYKLLFLECIWVCGWECSFYVFVFS